MAVKYEVTERYTVKIRDYESYAVEITVGATHLNLGVTDAELVKLNDISHAEVWADLKSFVDSELQSEVRSRLTRVAGWSEDPDNLATKVIGGRHGIPTNSKTSGAPSTGPRPIRRR